MNELERQVLEAFGPGGWVTCFALALRVYAPDFVVVLASDDEIRDAITDPQHQAVAAALRVLEAQGLVEKDEVTWRRVR